MTLKQHACTTLHTHNLHGVASDRAFAQLKVQLAGCMAGRWLNEGAKEEVALIRRFATETAKGEFSGVSVEDKP